MGSTWLSLLPLFGIIAAMWFWSRWRMYRFHQLWAQGQAAMEANDLVTAEVAFRRCTKILPVAAPVRRVFGALLVRRGKLKEAEEQLRFGAELEPRNPGGHVDLGFFLALCMPGRAEEAIDAFAKAIECKPELRALLTAEARLEPLRRNERFRRLLEPPRG